MSWMLNDVLCKDCGYEEYDAMYKRKNGPDDCPECGKTLSVDLRGLRFHIHGDGPGSFTPVDFGVLGKAETREDYNRCIKTIEKRFPGKTVHIEGESRAQRRDRTDTIRHNSYKRNKARSLDPQLMTQIDTHNKRLKREGRKPTKTHVQLAKGE